MTAARAIVDVLPDRAMLLAVAVLAALGALMVRAITGDEAAGAWSGEALRQLIYIGAGVVAMLILARIDYRVLARLAIPIYLGALGLLVLVLMTGADQFGARRWIDVGFTTIQPSEFAKIGVVVALAAFASRRDPGIRSTLTTLGLAGLPMALIVVEPDLGTTIVLAGTWVAMIAVWGLSWRVLGGLGLLAASLLPIAFAVAVPDYQRERLAVFFDPERDPLGSGYQLRQVEIALGAGGLTGRGFTGVPSPLDGLATRASDFSFAQLGEQIGFAGAALMLALYVVIAWRGVRAAAVAPDRFGELLAVGLTTVIVFQAVLHIAVNLRLFPATGIPLPFVSQGGSALFVMFAATGILQSIAAHRAPTTAEQWSGLSPRGFLPR
jgi:rod shape determining protein RodA